MYYLTIPFTFFTLLYVIFFTNTKKNIGRASIVFVLLLSIVLLGIIIAVQPFHGDSYRYAMGFLMYRDFTLNEIFNYQPGEYLYRILNWFVGQFTDNSHLFFLVVYIIFIVTFYKALKNIFSSFEKYTVFSFYVLYPYFLFYVVNGKRQGLGLVFMFLAISFLMKNENRKALFLFIVSGLIHSGMFLALPMAIIFMFFKDKNLLKITSIILLTSVFLSISGLNEVISGPLGDLLASEKRYNEYLTDDGFEEINYRTGFRIDFTVFSFLPIFLYIILRKQISKTAKKDVLPWLAVYMLLNSIYHTFSFVPFNDRFAIFSWFILPIVCFIIVRAVSKKYVLIFTLLFLLLNLVFLQTYTGKIFQTIEIF